MNPVSFPGQKKSSSTNNTTASNEGREPLNVEIDSHLYCEHCKQINPHCHKCVYGDFVCKKIFWMYSNKVEHPGWDEIKKQMSIAFNEHGRSKY